MPRSPSLLCPALLALLFAAGPAPAAEEVDMAALLQRLPAGDRTAWYAQGWHLLLRDKQAHNVYEDVAAYIRDPAAPLPSGAPPIPGAPSHAGPPARRPLL